MIIKDLTKEQEEKIPYYIEKWIGLAGGETNIPDSVSAIKKVYKNIGENEPIVLHSPSPMGCILTNTLSYQLDIQLYNQLNQLDIQLYNQLNQLGNQLNQLDIQLRSQGSNFRDWCLTIRWLEWCGWYDFAKYIGVKFTDEVYNDFMNFCSNVIFSIPYKGICFFSHKPIKIKWRNGVLHCADGAAVEFSDGNSVWVLNGVGVSKEIVETPAEKLNPEIVIAEQNAEVRREIVRKIGVERVILRLGAKTIDKWYDYELLEIEKPIKARYLFWLADEDEFLRVSNFRDAFSEDESRIISRIIS